MAAINWTLEAERWLKDIHEYIAAESPQAATRTIQGIYDRAQLLRKFPEMGQKYRASSRNVRILLYDHYRITYLITINGDIEILGVFHGALDLDQYKF